MEDENKKVDATITVVYKSGAVVSYHVNETADLLDKFVGIYRMALVNKEETVAKGCIGDTAMVINLNDVSSLFIEFPEGIIE